jgi:hypothetical protein
MMGESGFSHLCTLMKTPVFAGKKSATALPGGGKSGSFSSASSLSPPIEPGRHTEPPSSLSFGTVFAYSTRIDA